MTRTRRFVARLVVAEITLAGAGTAGAKPSFGTLPESSAAGDAFAAAHLALIIIVTIGLAGFAWMLYRRGKMPNREREFIEDIQEEEQRESKDRAAGRSRRSTGGEAEDRREPWEKPGNWWKKK